MYEAHFGLQGRPFDTGIAHEVDVFRGPRQTAIVDKTKLALAASDSVVTFCGRPGIGKTTLALAAVRSISTRLALAWLSSMPTNANEMLELLLVELGINAHRASRIERLQMWRQHLEEMSATDTRVFVIAERTEELAPEVLRALDALTGADASGSKGANVVLLGHQGLDGFLGSPSLESLRQRIRLRQRLEPFSSAELTDYLRHRVAHVGGNFEQLFAPGAAAAVYRLSGGVARLANTLCEAALTAAAATNTRALTSELIAQVAVDMLGVEEAAAPVAPAAPTPPPVATPGAVTIASVAIDITPVKAAAIVSAPKTASAAPCATEVPAAPIAVPTPQAPQPVIATAPTMVVTPPVHVTPTPAPVPAAPAVPVAPVVRAAAPKASPPPAPMAAPIPAPFAPAPVAAAPAPIATAPTPQPALARPPPMAAPPPAPTPTAVVAPTSSAAAAKPPIPRTPLPDFDATATDIPDVSSFDFPVLTDAVEETASLTPFARVLAPPPIAKTVATPPAARAPSASAPRPTAPPTRPSAAAAPATPPPTRRLLEPQAAAPSAPPPAAEIEEDPDALRQTQTMRAISMAKSIDDVSDSMAETLFGEADLDFLSAALASAVGEGEGEESQASASAQGVANAPAPPVDDLMDLFNLGPDAPLELIDDSATIPGDQRKTAVRRGG